MHNAEGTSRGRAVAHPVDVLTARALHYGLDPAASAGRAAGELAALAKGSRTVVERAMGRVERGLSQRPSGVGVRAKSILELALVLVLTGPAGDSALPQPR